MMWRRHTVSRHRPLSETASYTPIETPRPHAYPPRERLRPAYSSEAAISSIPLRPDSPAWLVEEVESTRAGLIKLRQNVVLLADPEDPDAFHPR